MNAYKNYKKRERDAETYKIVMDNCDAYIEHMDLIILDILHTDFGFGAERLKRVYREIDRRFNEYRRYMADGDNTKFNDGVERDDTWKLKRDLREIGFDYDAIVAEILEGGDKDDAKKVH